MARDHSKQIHALVRLLSDMASRIQDVVGLTFGQVLGLKAKKGNRVLDLPAKKTKARSVVIS